MLDIEAILKQLNFIFCLLQFPGNVVKIPDIPLQKILLYDVQVVLKMYLHTLFTSDLKTENAEADC